MPLEIITRSDHDRFRGLGLLAAAWCEYFLVHGPGDVEGQPLDPALPRAAPLGTEMYEFIADCYALTEDGRRNYTDVFLSRAKGWAKSELAGFIALFEALGPCRTLRDSFGIPMRAEAGDTFTVGEFVYEYEPGDFMGTPVPNPMVRCVATEEGQTDNTFGHVRYNLGGFDSQSGSARLIQTYGVRRYDVNAGGVKLPGTGEIVPSTSSADAKDGGRETFIVFDETHKYVRAELRRLYSTLTRNLSKRKAGEPWSLETSTMYAPGEDSIAERTHKHARAIREKRSAAVSTYFNHRQGHPDVDLKDIEAVRAAIVDAYGDAAEYTDIDRKLAQLNDPRETVEDFRRYVLNQPTTPSDAWIAAVDWNPCEATDARLEDGDVITLGFDGSAGVQRGMADATALIACRVSDSLIVPLLIDEQPEGPAGKEWAPDREGFMDEIADAFDRYTVVGFYADPPRWEESVSTWDREYGDSLVVKAAGNRSAVGWRTQLDVRMSNALDAFESAVLSRDIRHPGDPHMTRHILNARRWPAGQKMRIRKENPASKNKIDAAIAATIAYQARLDYVLANPDLKPERRKTRITRINPRKGRNTWH